MTAQRTARRRLLAWAIAVVSIVGAALVLGKTFAEGGSSEALPLWSLALAAVWTVGGLLILWVAGADPDRTRATPGRAIGVSSAIGAAVALMSLIGGLVLVWFPPTTEFFSSALRAATETPLPIVIGVALIAGAGEEVFFRLGLASVLDGWTRWVIPNVLYTAVTLASGNVALAAVAPILGLACSAAREWTGRWFAPIIVHAIWTLVMVGVFPVAAGQ